MRGGTVRQPPMTTLDVAIWIAVGVAAVATLGNALMAILIVAPSELALMGACTVVLVTAGGFAAWRHLRAVRIANEARNDLARAQGDVTAARDRLSFARHAAALMSSLPQAEGVRAVLAESLTRFAADAAAVVDDDIVMMTAEGVDESEAQAAVLHLALETVKSGRSITLADSEAQLAALTAPLRARGELHDVLVVWRHGHRFRAEDLDGLSLVARIVELSLENSALVEDVRSQLGGTLHAMVDLVEQRLPDYIPHSSRVGAFAVALGEAMGMSGDDAEQLRVAAMLHDVGMLEVPESILNAPRLLTPEEHRELREHPLRGAELTRVANFAPMVQDAILSHHERVDGTGYPRGLRGDEIPLAARILAVCDAYVAMISDRPQRVRISPDAALGELRAGAGTAYDAGVVAMFIEGHEEAAAAGA
jgi:putative nucleotidyltransferase with HDIG domain